ncbi:MAG: glycerol-3-phosphate acyltransferase [Ignavibacteriales bacterium CG07_land_8_20_14_0_80_59_12]|nr:MAG: glycerol-3-phosphate acyltransferase [Ignavibacteriales bacterium CG07_land_8_20_14_0_80_59_12]
MIDLIPEIIVVALGYLIGSIPTAYAVGKRHTGEDITTVGSGNSGTMNSYRFTGSQKAGVLVLLGDVFRGFAAVWVALALFGPVFYYMASAALAAVLGHNFSIWLGFKGGRGLAVGAGALLLTMWPVLAVWGAIWLLGKYLFKQTHLASGFAILLTPILLVVLPGSILDRLVKPEALPSEVRVFFVILSLLLLLKHVKPIRQAITRLGESAGSAV